MMTTATARKIAELLATGDASAIDAITDGDLALAIIALDLENLRKELLWSRDDSPLFPEEAAK